MNPYLAPFLLPGFYLPAYVPPVQEKRAFVMGTITIAPKFGAVLKVNGVSGVVPQILFIGNDNEVQVASAVVDGASVTDAAISMTLYDSTDTEVEGAVDIALPYNSGSALYVGSVPSSVTLTAGCRYTLTVTAAASEGNGEWDISCVAANREW